MKKIVYIIALSTIAIAGLWLYYMPSETNTPTVAQTLHLPDRYMNDVIFSNYDNDGKLKQQISVYKAKHYAQGNLMQYMQPILVFYSESGGNWKLTAKKGLSRSGFKFLELEQDVVLHRDGSDNNAEITAKTSKLSAQTDQGIVSTHEAVTITQPGVVISGLGLEGTLKTGNLHTLANTKTDIRY